MDYKGIYMEIPDIDIEHLAKISKISPKIKRVSIIRSFLFALRGIDRDCHIIIFDKKKLRIVSNFVDVTDIGKTYEDYTLNINYADGVININGQSARGFKEAVK